MTETHGSPVEIQTELSRDLGLTSALAIGVGTMIAAGIFTLSGLAIRNVGSAAILSFLLAALVALFTALTYCEFVSVYPQSGEGYLYARKTFSPPLAYFVGWTLLLGYTSSCAFYIASLSSYFTEFIWHTPFEQLSGLAVLLALTLLNTKGTKESARFQVVVTATKIGLLIWFVAGGLDRVDAADMMERFSTDIFRIGSTAGMVFITFFGFSAIAASAGEVRNPIKTIPRAIFSSMIIVVVLYTLVVLVVASAGLSEYNEAAMGSAARQFLGPIGSLVIVAGALFSMVSASNASILASSRITLSMSRLGHLPRKVGVINSRSRTPIAALLLAGGVTAGFTISLPLEELAHFADTVLLLALTMVNGALIVHRRKYPDIERPFRVPLVPLLPILGIIANLYLLSQIAHHLAPVLMAAVCLLIGMAAFLIWKGRQTEEVEIPGPPSRILLERHAMTEGRFRVLVPLANPANVPQLIDLAAAVASERDGEIIALRVVLVPEQMPPSHEEFYREQEREILELAHAHAQQYGIPVTSLVRVGHRVARAILETARERACDLIVLGWKGYSSTAQKILGEEMDAVVNHARTDLMLVKSVGDRPLRRILLPTAGGEHARRAEEYAASLARSREGSLTVCSVVSPDPDERENREVEERLAQAVARVRNLEKQRNGLQVDGKTISHRSVSAGIIREARNYDAIVVGAAGRSFYPQILFGRIPEIIAKRSDRSVIVVKRYHPIKALIGRVMGD